MAGVSKAGAGSGDRNMKDSREEKGADIGRQVTDEGVRFRCWPCGRFGSMLSQRVATSFTRCPNRPMGIGRTHPRPLRVCSIAIGWTEDNLSGSLLAFPA